MFNLWRRYPKWKPKGDGLYLCTVGKSFNRVVKILQYDISTKKWIDISRQSVFDGYVVYKYCRAPIPDNRVYTDGLCDRSDEVVAWKKLPKEYRRGKTNKVHIDI